MTKQEIFDALETLVSRSNNEKDYLEYCLIDDFEDLIDNYNCDKEDIK